MTEVVEEAALVAIENDNHALLVGAVAGLLMRGASEDPAFLVEILLDDDNNYSNQIRIGRPSGTYLVTVEVED